MRVLITGASGFLGSWICRTLATDHEVSALLRPTSDPYNLCGVNRLPLIREESERWAEVIQDQKPDVLVLNDWWGVGNEHRNDIRQYENVSRHQTLAKIARIAGVGTVVGVGSQAELGPIQNEISDDQHDAPTTEYGKAKVATRVLVADALQNSNTRFIWMRVFSTYGALDTGSWLIPQVVTKLSQSEKMDLTKGEQDWSYLHAYDLGKGFQMAIENAEVNGAVNIGNPKTVKIREVVELIAERLGKLEFLNFGAVAYRDDQVMKLIPLCEKLINSGWLPEVELKEGLEHTINWLLGKSEINMQLTTGIEKKFSLPQRKS